LTIGGRGKWPTSSIASGASREARRWLPSIGGAAALRRAATSKAWQIRARIPARFWKVIVAPVKGGITAFGVVLEQDLSDVEFEFVVSKGFAPHMYPLAEMRR
jgi:hypothetical protein